VKKGQNFYRRDPSKALSGMIGLTLEERGVYNTVLDLLYSTWRPLEDDRAFLANWCGCAVQKLNPIVRRLIEKGRLITFEEGGRNYLSDEAFEAERATVKGASDTRSGRAQVGGKSGEVEEKSAGVGQNPALLDGSTEEKQPVTALEKSREEKNTPLPPEGAARRKPKRPIPDGFPDQALIDEEQAKARAVGANVDIANQAERFRNWSISKDSRYADWPATWRNWCDRAVKAAPKTAIAALASRPAQADDARWRARVKEFQLNRYWPTDDAGPRPGQPGCMAPAAILAEFGFSPRPANDPKPTDLFAQGAAA
jgi:hypothetical protein